MDLKVEVAERAREVLKGIERDTALAHEKWKTGHITVDYFQKLSLELREKQLEALKVLASVAIDGTGRWDKILAE